MRIVIVGVGKVGKILTEYLSQEKHDVTIIDTNAKLIEDYTNIFDVNGIVGNGASNDVQIDAEVQQADVLIAATSSDEVNILCCLLARKNKVVHTIARVRNPEYSKQMDFMHQELGISMVVNPELESANEIARMLRFPSSAKVDFFANGQAEIAQYTIPLKSILANKTLSQVQTELNVRFLVSAVERDGSVSIPGGSFLLKEGDKIFITAASDEMSSLFKRIGTYKQSSKNVMIIGGGKISYYLAKQLLESNVKVKIIELNENKCQELCEQLDYATIINTDGTNQDDLIEEGIEHVDALVALTGLDEENIVISLFAEMMNVPKVITKINHYSYSNILKSVGLESTISPKRNTANHILRYVRSLNNSLSQVKTLYRFLDNQVEASEFYISHDTNFTNVPLKDLNLRSHTLIACLIRGQKVIIPNGNDVILPEDSVVVVTKIPYLSDFKDVLKRG